MSNTIIQVENLGKKYLIKHQQQGSYTALRDVITDKVKSLGKKIISPWNHKQSSTHSTTEKFWALKDISFKVKQGEVVGIIGRNGVGKTTLLKILSRITEPTTGRIRIKGRVASLLEVGTGFHPELTGRENIFLNGAILGMRKAETKRKFDEIVAFAEVEQFLDTPVKRYSSGMHVRLAFAVAAHLDPEILLVDEVLAVGDVAFQKKCLGKMDSIAGEGRTILFVSHNMSVLQSLCPRALMLVDGRLYRQGPSSEIIETYLKEGTQKSGELVWEWSSNKVETLDLLVPLSIRILNHEGNTTDYISSNYPFTVEFIYRILRPVSNLRIGITLQTAHGDSVCVSYDRDKPEQHGFYSREPGVYRSTCVIPPNILNDRQFILGIISGIKGAQRLYRDPHLLSFRVDATDGIGAHWGDHGRRQGILRPDFNWFTEVMNET
jgi:lipopolysaccharide transport system ATP-binding protein